MPMSFFLPAATLLLCLTFERAFAQPYKAQDSVAIYKMLEEADASDLSGDMDKALGHAREALALSKSKKMDRGAGFALLKIADLVLKKDGAAKTSALYDEPFRIGLRLNDSFLLGLTKHQLAQYYRDQVQYPEAIDSYKQAVSFYRPSAEGHYIALASNDQGLLYERMGQYDKAIDMYLQAIRFFEKENDIKEAANTTGNIGIVYYRMGKKQEAIRQFRVSASMRESIGDVKGLTAVYGNLVTAFSSLDQQDSASHYQRLALQNAEKTGVKHTLAQAYANASSLASRQQKWKEALDYERKSIALYQDVGDQLKLANRFLSLGLIYDKLNDSIAAENSFASAMDIARKLQNKPLFQSIYTSGSAFYARRNNHQRALDYFKFSTAYKDSVLNEKVSANVEELKTKYETEKKDFDIARLETEKKLKQLELEKKTAIIEGNRILAARKEAEIALLKRDEEIKRLELAQKKEELARQELLARESEQQVLRSLQELQIAENEKKLRQRQLERERLLRNGMIALVVLLFLIGWLLFNRFKLRKKLEEKEKLLEVRNRISKDLHDDIGSTLTSIHILSRASEQSLEKEPGNVRRMLGDISQQSQSIQQNMSDIVWAIRPDNDKVENLVNRMRENIGLTLEPRQIQCSFEADENLLRQSLPMEARKEILLIYKEAINNILKHAHATEVNIRVTRQDGFLRMTVRDNGTWKEKSTTYSGTGTTSMSQRAASINGTLRIDGSAHGTTVTLDVPVT